METDKPPAAYGAPGAIKATAAQAKYQPFFTQAGFQLFADPVTAKHLTSEAQSVGDVIRRHLDQLRPGDTFDVVTSLPYLAGVEERLQDMRQHVREAKQIAMGVTSALQAPHRMQQIGEGSFDVVTLHITCDDENDLSAFLSSLSPRMLRIHLGVDIRHDLHRLCDLICAAVAH